MVREQWWAVWGACLALVLGGCASAPPSAGQRQSVVAAVAISRAWVEGRTVDYITTDVSDAATARAMGANHVPRLADALPAPGRPALLERVYAFPGGEQISIFQSAPSPAGADNTDRAYTPLWRMVAVRWVKPDRVRELRSEEELLAAEESGDVALEMTRVVVNCPILRSADGTPLGVLR